MEFIKVEQFLTDENLKSDMKNSLQKSIMRQLSGNGGEILN